VLDAIFEEHQVHRLVLGVVEFELLLELGQELVLLTELDVVFFWVFYVAE
jgi:hypothetical protein